MDLSLYRLTKEQQENFDKIFDADGEVSEEVDKRLNELNDLIMKKAVTVCEYRQYLEDMERVVTDRVTELSVAKQKIKSKIERLDSYVLGCMNVHSIKSIESDIWSIKIRKPSEVVDVIDIDLVPSEFLRQPPPAAEKAEIKKVLKQGLTVPGCELVMGKASLIYKQGR